VPVSKPTWRLIASDPTVGRLKVARRRPVLTNWSGRGTLRCGSRPLLHPWKHRRTRGRPRRSPSGTDEPGRGRRRGTSWADGPRDALLPALWIRIWEPRERHNRPRIAGGGKLAERVAWHAEQDLTVSALRSGFLSTFLLSLLTLDEFEYAISGSIASSIRCLSFGHTRTLASKPRTSTWLNLSASSHCPLNIRHNRREELEQYRRFLSN
jgi:hypothetical protein